MTKNEIDEELQEIREARRAIYRTGTSYSRNGIQLTRASLVALNDRETALRAMLARLTGSAAALADFRNL